MGKPKYGSRRASHIQPLFEVREPEAFRRQYSEPGEEALDTVACVDTCKIVCQDGCKMSCQHGCEMFCKTGCETFHKG